MPTLSNTHQKTGYKGFLWNSIGSMINAAASLVLLLCVTRTVGAAEGGVFSLAFATAQILLTFGKFGVRSFQATDIRREIPFGVYLQSRIWFCLSMLLLGNLYTAFAGYELRKSFIFSFVCLIKMSDAIEDVFHGELQNSGHLDTAGKLLTIRNLCTMLLFGLCILFSKDLLLTCIIASAASILISVFLNAAVTKKYTDITLCFDKKASIYLVKACFPLFAGSFLSLYIYNIPKYAIDYIGSEEEITYYSIIFMPAFMINLFSEFIFKPLLTNIASMWNEKAFKAFYVMIRNLILNILGLTAAATFAAYLAGTQVLSWFYAVDVTPYRTELTILMLSGGFSAAVYLLYNVLTSMRLQKVIIRNYFIASVTVTFLSYFFVRHFGIRGASAAYFMSETLLFILMLTQTCLGWRKEKKHYYENSNHNISGDK